MGWVAGVPCSWLGLVCAFLLPWPCWFCGVLLCCSVTGQAGRAVDRQTGQTGLWTMRQDRTRQGQDRTSGVPTPCPTLTPNLPAKQPSPQLLLPCSATCFGTALYVPALQPFADICCLPPFLPFALYTLHSQFSHFWFSSFFEQPYL